MIRVVLLVLALLFCIPASAEAQCSARGCSAGGAGVRGPLRRVAAARPLRGAGRILAKLLPRNRGG